MIDNTLPNWRSILFVPTHMDRFVESAHKRCADAVQLDLEDSVPLECKAQARQMLIKQTNSLAAQHIDTLIRVNRDLTTCVHDLDVAVMENVKAITIPKVIGPEHIRLIDEAITVIEKNKGLSIGHIRLIAMIETIEGLLAVNSIAQASPRLAALALGSEDLCLDGGFDPTEENLFNPCQKLIYAARLANINAYGFPGSIADYSDIDAFSIRITKAKSMGFDGAFCIHPQQVKPINDAHQPSQFELEQAQRIVSSYDQAIKNKQAVVEIDGKMVDLPVVERARKLLLGQ